MDLIPTRYRAKLRKGWSYPIGAEAISLALADTPQARGLEISFHSGNARTEDGPGDVAAVWFRRWEKSRSAPAFLARNYEPGWGLYVYSVPSPERHTIREQLLTAGLPRIRAWLLEPRPDNWHFGRHELTLSSTPDEGLSARESG